MTALRGIVRRVVPASVRRRLRPRPINQNLGEKGEEELGFWRGYAPTASKDAENGYYQKFMMDMGNVKEQSFFDGMICLDLGCGPMGSMEWLTNAKARIGLDPLSDSYREFGIDKHSMLYLNCGAESIPLPASYVDVIFSMNSLDHVDDFPAVCSEIRRVLTPGGYFIASINLNEPPTPTEPWTLTEALLDEKLFRGWEKQFYRVRQKLEASDNVYFSPYRLMYEDSPSAPSRADDHLALWCRFRSK